MTWPSARRPVSFSTDIEELEPWGEVEGLFAALTANGWLWTAMSKGPDFEHAYEVILGRATVTRTFKVFGADSLVGALRAATEWAKGQETP